MENNFHRLFNIEFLKRIISAAFFIPLALLPVLLSNYLLLVVYLIFNSLILIELFNMKNVHITKFINIYAVVSTFSFFIFILFIIARPDNKSLVLQILITIWLFDTFSYLGGKLIGGPKLIPKISSGKTLSGLISGTILTICLMGFAIIFFTNNNFFHNIILTIIVIILAFTGDLIASILKRASLIKDSGNIMPGHGGLFDRFDSFIFVFFIFGILQRVL